MAPADRLRAVLADWLWVVLADWLQAAPADCRWAAVGWLADAPIGVAS
ncbi:hypothetical protein ACWEP5_09690 [Nocardia niigatensis]